MNLVWEMHVHCILNNSWFGIHWLHYSVHLIPSSPELINLTAVLNIFISLDVQHTFGSLIALRDVLSVVYCKAGLSLSLWARLLTFQYSVLQFGFSYSHTSQASPFLVSSWGRALSTSVRVEIVMLVLAWPVNTYSVFTIRGWKELLYKVAMLQYIGALADI